MAGIAGLSTTYNTPNYVGELYAVTPADTPFLSAIGGLTGGESTNSTEFEWQTSDLRDPSAERQRLEGADAPPADTRVRGVGRNVVEIHQEAVGVSYSKLGATGNIATTNNTGVPGSNPVQDELAWQTEQALKSMAMDIEISLLLGTYQRPNDNTTPRKTRGLLNAIATNRTDKSSVTYTGFTSATDTITGAHALANGDKVVFDTVGAASSIVPGRVYFVVNVSTTVSFKVASTQGGTALTLGTATGISLHKPQTAALATADLDDIVQLAYDNGGFNSDTTVLMVGSRQKRAISKAYATAYGNTNLIGTSDRNVGGVAVDTIVTDFGRLGIMLARTIPADAIVAVDLGQCAPVHLNIPGKGFLFQEDLAKTGAQEKKQIYGEVGLKYGNERSHALLRGLAI